MQQTCTDMSDFTPKVPVSLQIRKIIFDNYNDDDVKFTNDEIFEILKKNGDIDPDWIIDDLEKDIRELCDSGAARNIAQNFTTMWLKLFEKVKANRCNSCHNDVFLSPSEQRVCPGCKSKI